jgi:hypothetical protein
MTTRPWRAAALLAPAAIAAAALTVPAASASAATPSWQLTNEFASSPVCYTTAGGTNQLEINLNGTWSTPINIGASGLPAGVSVAGTTLIDFYYYLDGSYTVAYTTPPIPAGWSNGTGPVRLASQPDPSSYTLDAEGYVNVTVAAGRAANSSFNITLSANDGTTLQTESVPVTIKSSCKRRY